MAILKIMLKDATGQPMSGQSVKATGCDTLQTNALGMTQFLLGGDASVAIDINGAQVWTGNAELLAREEVFTKTAAGFVRAAAN